ncbi:hypothetical protein Ahia01_000013700 [Argonauta hians]
MLRGILWEFLQDNSVLRGILWEFLRDNSMFRRKLWEFLRDNSVLRGKLWEFLQVNSVLRGKLWEFLRDNSVFRAKLWEFLQVNSMFRGKLREFLRDNSMLRGILREFLRDNSVLRAKLWEFLQVNSVLRAKFFEPSPEDCRNALAAALSKIFWQAGGQKSAIVTLSSGTAHFIGGNKCKADQLTETVSVIIHHDLCRIQRCGCCTVHCVRLVLFTMIYVEFNVVAVVQFTVLDWCYSP